MKDLTPDEYSAAKKTILAVLDPSLKGATVAPADVVRLITHPYEPITVKKILKELGNPDVDKLIEE